MDKNSNRILLFTTAFRPFIGGSEIAIEEIASLLSDIEFDVLTPRYTKKLADLESVQNIHIHRVGSGWLGDKFFFPLNGFFTARRLIQKNNYKALHAYQASYGGLAAVLTKLFNPGLKLILTLQEGQNLEAQNLIIKIVRKLIIKKSDIITAISNYLGDYAKRFNKKAQVIIIPNGVDTKVFSQEYSYGELSEMSDGLGIKPGEKVIISISRFVPKNGIDILIDSLAILKSTYKAFNFRLLLVGDGAEKDNLKNKIKNLDLNDEVIFTGSIIHNELPKYLKISDVFVRPSRSEGLGNSFLEAMVAGIPIIGTNVGGIGDFLKDRETGLFTTVNNAENLAQKINLILTDKNLRDKIIENSKKLALEKYDWNKIAGEFKNIYLAYQ